MSKLDNITINNEYYFLTANCFCAGFVAGIDNNVLHIKNGSFFANEDTFFFEDAYLELSGIVCFATV